MHACLPDSSLAATIFGGITIALTFPIFYATFLFKEGKGKRYPSSSFFIVTVRRKYL
jgi:hypothetical protein